MRQCAINRLFRYSPIRNFLGAIDHFEQPVSSHMIRAREPTRATRTVAIALLIFADTDFPAQMAAAQTASPLPLVFTDMQHFVDAHGRLAQSSDTIAVLRQYYFDRATPGLRLYITKYGLDTTSLLQAIRCFPDDYAAVGRRLEWLLGQQDSIQQVYAAFARLVPVRATLPAFFLVGAHTGTASGSEVGPLFSMENGAVNVARANLPEFLVHELTHIQQFSTIGMPRYQSIFGERKSLLGYTVREGIAEFVADLVTGRITQQRAREYLRQNQRGIWESFRREMCGTETGDWMFVRPKDPAQPSFVAYALGAEIARQYYESRPDKRRAMSDLLAVDDYAGFFAATGFAQSRGESPEQLASLLRACPR